MNEQLKKDHRGSLFPNDRKTKPTHPDFTGKIVIEGKEWRIAAWENKTAEGKTYLSLITSPPLPADSNVGGTQGNQGSATSAQNTGNNNTKPVQNEHTHEEPNGLSDDLDDLEAILRSSDDDNPFN